MSFTQTTFLFIFMPASILIYLAAYKLSGRNIRIGNAVLICEGLLFYWWAEPRLVFFFVSLTALMYILGNAIQKSTGSEERKEITTFAVILFTFIPLFYKYLPAVKLTTSDDQPMTMPLFAGMIVPIGIAFFTLGAISYILDIYMGKAELGKPEETFLHVMLFPKIICGPVVLWRDFKPQIYKRKISSEKVAEGIKRIIVGYAKKVVIADTFAVQITLIEQKMASATTDIPSAWLLALLYFFRIYYDFSGYSDIAIGLCRTFGFEIGENFNYPYKACSLTDFWRRWHISLGRWFREYIYIPLGGNRSGMVYLNILITFCVAGLWHGWKLNILIWAAVNGVVVAIEKMCGIKASGKGKESEQLPNNAGLRSQRKELCINTGRAALTMLFVYFGWILFRAADITAAGEALKALFVPATAESPNFTWQFFMTRRIVVLLLIAVFGALGGFRGIAGFTRSHTNETTCDIIEKCALILIFVLDIIFVVSENFTPFVYTLFP